jgi:phosphomannomutase
LKVVLDSGSWVLLRPSGTEPLVRTYAETPELPQTDRLLRWAGDMVRDYFKGL